MAKSLFSNICGGVGRWCGAYSGRGWGDYGYGSTRRRGGGKYDDRGGYDGGGRLITDVATSTGIKFDDAILIRVSVLDEGYLEEIRRTRCCG